MPLTDRPWLPIAAVAVTLTLWASAFVAIRHLGHDFPAGALSLGGMDQRLQAQARLVGTLAEAYAALPARQRYAFTTWGLRDRDSWLRSPYQHGDPNDQPLWWVIVHAFFFACFCASQTINLLALFLKFDNSGRSVLDPLRESSFGIFLIHYAPLLWLQYALFGITLAPIPQVTAILKALIVFVVTLAISWAATVAVRKLPGVTRVL